MNGPFSVQQIKYEFLLYMKGLGGRFEDWYVGAAGNPEETLRMEHRAREGDVPWMYKPAVSSKATRTILKYFREVLHTDGGDADTLGEGATYAFLFRKGPHTCPRSDGVDAPPCDSAGAPENAFASVNGGFAKSGRPAC